MESYSVLCFQEPRQLAFSFGDVQVSGNGVSSAQSKTRGLFIPTRILKFVLALLSLFGHVMMGCHPKGHKLDYEYDMFDSRFFGDLHFTELHSMSFIVFIINQI